MARVKGGLANLMPVVTDSQQEQASQKTPAPAVGEGIPDRLSIVAPATSGQGTVPAEAAPAATSRPKKAARSKMAKQAEPEFNAELPRYLQLERKDVRMRSDQLDSLTTLSRRLNKQRQGRGERITENTLIRVAIDLILEHADELGGFTEDDLRSSVGSDRSIGR